MTQTPPTGSFLLAWQGDTLKIGLSLDSPRKGRAVFRTDLGTTWTDLPMKEVSPGAFSVEVSLARIGVFSGKACFFPAGSSVPEWPEGGNLRIKVVSALTRRNNSIYTVFPRQFGSFREVARRLGTIMGTMGFRIVQTLPPFPVPTTYAVMGEYGCPFAATDFLSVDPAMAEFDPAATPLDQFIELVDAVHARDGLFFVDLPANHTGWASTLQTHHPDWFRREPDGRFHSPGAWGVTWADLVELDYAQPGLCDYMADVFLFWCRKGVDGFRCDAGYMIPLETWRRIVTRVRDEYPDTVFMLEGLGGDLRVTDALLNEADLDWAYSEIFQTYDRRQFEDYLPGAIARSETFGTLVHFAETHDNDRLAKGGSAYARLRVQLAALLSWQGAWGIANGVEWYATEKIDVHGKNALNWGAADNMVDLIARLNGILSTHPSFAGANHLEVVTRGAGNTLAVLREGGLLILANLDCSTGVMIDWDRARFSAPDAEDLVSGRTYEATKPLYLAPGEVLCLQDAAAHPPVVSRSDAADAPCLFNCRFPRDFRRFLSIPGGQRFGIEAENLFQATLVDPQTNRTLAFGRARAQDGAFRLVLTAPAYAGDGTRCRALVLKVVVFGAERATHGETTLLVPPPSECARLKIELSGDDVRARPDERTILSNGAGAAAQVRLGWGRIESQYDAFLAANTNPSVPADRLVLWSRTRVWLQYEGYTHAVDETCLTRVEVDPAGRWARWRFTVPCGLGYFAAFVFELALAEGRNVAQLRVTRVTQDGAGEVNRPVRLVFRPDLEWRTFHGTTKAYRNDTDRLFVRAVRPCAKNAGFTFDPYGAKFEMRVTGGVCHLEPEWTYNVAHAEEARRGQEDSGDVFSPAWISADLAIGDETRLVGAYADKAVPFDVAAEVPRNLTFAQSLARALDLYIVRRDDLKTVIAGYPWFLDWGRDTFIFLRGMLAAGKVDEALQILRAFAAFEEKGTLPNIINGTTAANRDTTDAPLWFVRCVRELEKMRGVDVSGLKKTCASIVDHYLSGTPNGIHADKDSGLVWSPSHFTWMDTNYPACTPRVGYPVEIQALWISALEFLGRNELAARARASLQKYFKCANGYRDCLAAPNGEPAAQAVPEETIRPNQLFLITLGILDDTSILRATEELLIPGGIRSLEAGNPLYRGTYAGDEDTSRKPAYHNGTVWAWPFPLYAEALVRTKSCSREVALQLLATAVENLNTGCLCHMSEIADGDAPHAQKGCCAQAWSDSELLRVWLSLMPSAPDLSR